MAYSPITAFPNGVSSFGIPMLGGMFGIPFTGNYYFVDAVNGADGNVGSADSPMASLVSAYGRCVSGHNDVVVIIGNGGTTGTQRLSSTLVWAKHATHLVGITAPTAIGQRARISTATGATANVNPLVQVTAQGCVFANFSTFQGVGQASTDEQLWSEEGQRNYYWNVQFGGMGSANGAARAGSYSLRLYGGSECTFDSCTIGLDTIDRSAANASVRLRKNASSVASTRNVFRNCLFPMRATATTPLFVDANESGGIDRFALFEGCTFINFGTSAVAAVVAFHASQGGYVVMNSSAVGATDWTATDTSVVQILGPVPNGDTSGMSVDSNAT